MQNDQGAGAPQALVRPATPADSGVIIQLIVALAEFERLPPPDEAAQGRLLADAFGAHRRFEVFLAELEGQVVGYAFVFETYSTFLARPSLYLEDLFVLPAFRSRRAGYALMKYCAQQAWKRGCARLDWVVLEWNTHAIDFYERFGAKHMDDWLLYRLDRPALKRLVAS